MIVVQLLVVVLVGLELLILARVLMGWAGMNPYQNDMARWIFDITEPILRPIREFLPQAGMWDFSPIVAFLIISMVIQVLLSI